MSLAVCCLAAFMGLQAFCYAGFHAYVQVRLCCCVGACDPGHRHIHLIVKASVPDEHTLQRMKHVSKGVFRCCTTCTHSVCLFRM